MENIQMEEFIIEQMEVSLHNILIELKEELEELLGMTRQIDFSYRKLKTIDNNPECLERIDVLLKLEKLESIVSLMEAAKKFAIELGNEDLTDQINDIILIVNKDKIKSAKNKT